jgi:hypothetical protein
MTTGDHGHHQEAGRYSNSLFGVAAELLFVILPFIVLIIVVGYREQGMWHLLAAPDWSLGAAVLIGQSIVKLVAGVTASRRERPWERTALVVAVLIVILLVPSLVVLALMQISDKPPTWLVVFQLALFILGAITFLLFGTVGQSLVDGKKKANPDSYTYDKQRL